MNEFKSISNKEISKIFKEEINPIIDKLRDKILIVNTKVTGYGGLGIVGYHLSEVEEINELITTRQILAGFVLHMDDIIRIMNKQK
jgi:hypothetical protein